MEVQKVCRLCLSESANRDMNTTYRWLEEKEIYSDMLKECFNIVFNTNLEFSAICDLCVTNLRASLYFKHQVLQSQEELMKRITSSECNALADKIPYTALVRVKEEINAESDEYFCEGTIKEESPPPQPVAKRKAVSTHKKPLKDLKPKLNELSSVDSCDRSKTKQVNNRKELKIVKNRKITIKGDLKINLAWTTRSAHDKRKHRENLLTILRHSNVTPFKNRSLLGFMCGYCDAVYPDPADLRTHTADDHGKERLDFKSSFDMTEYNVKLDVTDLCCSLCCGKMDNLTTLKEHLVKVHDKTFHSDIKDHIMQFKLKKGDVFDCAMCPSTYETFKMLKQHMNKHYSNYSCTKCDTSFATKRSLNAHQTTHQEGSFKCDLCDKVFSSKTKKQYHEKTKHLGARCISNCPFCDAPFRSYYQRNQHLVKVHNSEAQYKCNVCNKGYILKSLLMCHIKKNHLMERNCQCTECGYRFFSKKALNAHMIKHTGERKYSCEVCRKSYARKYTLREHMRIHNNDRRFKCDVCGAAFVQKCSLKNHLLSHHGISMAASDIPISLEIS